MKILVLHSFHEATVQNPHSWLSSCGVTHLGSKNLLLAAPSKETSKLIMGDANAAQLALCSEALGAVSNQTSECWDCGSESLFLVHPWLLILTMLKCHRLGKSYKHVRYAAVSPSSVRLLQWLRLLPDNSPREGRHTPGFSSLLLSQTDVLISCLMKTPGVWLLSECGISPQQATLCNVNTNMT